MPGLAGLTQPGIAWGNGANGSGAGPAADVSCGSCHNPHGNGQYRILNTIPGATGIDATWGGGQYPTTALTSVIGYGTATANAAALFTTGANHDLAVNNQIVVAGNSTTAANRTLWIDTIVSHDRVHRQDEPAGGSLRSSPSSWLPAPAPAAPCCRRASPSLSYSNKVYTTVASHGLLIGDNVTVTRQRAGCGQRHGRGCHRSVRPDLHDYRRHRWHHRLGGKVDPQRWRSGHRRCGPRRLRDARNYTVIQDPSPGPSWSATVGTTFVYTTAAAHGFAVGDTVNVTGMTVGGSTSAVQLEHHRQGRHRNDDDLHARRRVLRNRRHRRCAAVARTTSSSPARRPRSTRPTATTSTTACRGTRPSGASNLRRTERPSPAAAPPAVHRRLRRADGSVVHLVPQPLLRLVRADRGSDRRHRHRPGLQQPAPRRRDLLVPAPHSRCELRSRLPHLPRLARLQCRR